LNITVLVSISIIFFGHWHDGISYGHLNQYNCSILTDSYLERERPKIVTIDISSDESITKEVIGLLNDINIYR